MFLAKKKRLSIFHTFLSSYPQEGALKEDSFGFLFCSFVLLNIFPAFFFILQRYSRIQETA